ncbi:MAG: hypothetical protein LBH71_04270 [Oscillospiraceae bacterium]|jgi:penicillin-binding protein 2|nr:hypothetical protein [Oscillospiraceae bacterium]
MARRGNSKFSHPVIMNTVIIVVFIAFSISIFKTQILDRDQYTTLGNIVSSYDVIVQSARGEIVDRNGNPIVSNRQGNAVVFNASFFPEDQKSRNEIIHNLIKLFEASGEEYIDNLPIVAGSGGKLAFEQERESDIEWLKSADMLNLNSYATAQNCMDALIKRYSLENYSLQDARKIASICTDMKKNYFSKSYPFTFAQDVSTQLVSKVMENSHFYRGVEVAVEAYRMYDDGTWAPHIVGRTAPINAGKYSSEKDKLKEAIKKAEAKGASSREIADLERNAYKLTDSIGEFGIEDVMENYLRGSRGVKTIVTDTNDNIEEFYSVEPKQGDTVVLTLDKKLQKVAQDALKNRVDTLQVRTRLPCAASVVVLKVDTGEILACATYPSYDISTYKENYKELSDPKNNSPLWNRALMSTYEPGSTFKPLVATAGLETNTINSSTHVHCTGRYNFFKDTTFICQGHHRSVDVVSAIDKSCNIFFYETGRKLGIEKINEYGAMFGLGQATGVELPEASGLLASKEYRESIGGTWYPGDTVQAAIGQSDNLFTPLQLANYVATIANGGKRLMPHFIKSVRSSDYSKTILEKTPEMIVDTGVSEKTLALVKEGMKRVGTIGFCARAFAKLPITAAAKTGTSEVKKVINGRIIEGNNGFLISFAPYEKPEIALAVVVETADAGSLTAVVAADIYDYYFSNKGIKEAQGFNQLLS